MRKQATDQQVKDYIHCVKHTQALVYHEDGMYKAALLVRGKRGTHRMRVFQNRTIKGLRGAMERLDIHADHPWGRADFESRSMR